LFPISISLSDCCMHLGISLCSIFNMCLFYFELNDFKFRLGLILFHISFTLYFNSRYLIWKLKIILCVCSIEYSRIPSFTHPWTIKIWQIWFFQAIFIIFALIPIQFLKLLSKPTKYFNSSVQLIYHIH